MTIFYLNAFISLLIIGLPFLLMYIRPKKINNLSGYRTERSMRSQGAWDYAQKYWPRLLVKMSIGVVVVQVILCLCIEALIALLLTLFIWVLCLFTTIFLTEQELKEKFDKKNK